MTTTPTFHPGDPVAVTWAFDGSGIALRFSAEFVREVGGDNVEVRVDPAVGDEPFHVARIHVEHRGGERIAVVHRSKVFEPDARLDSSDGLFR